MVRRPRAEASSPDDDNVHRAILICAGTTPLASYVVSAEAFLEMM